MMTTIEPITFAPIYKKRVWGGRQLETVFGRELPDLEAPYGESWELTDREEGQSRVVSGVYQGESLNSLWTHYREEVFGPNLADSERFPLLIKILDAQSDLSVQVHPPESVARELNGEAKTETWYVADCDEDAKLYVGLKKDVSESSFKEAIEMGTVEECIHEITPVKGGSIHIPSGRLHSIGAGLLIYEIQQNSDTTYRVFDWNRLGLDGQPRQLHVERSMLCIDFDDIEPSMHEDSGEACLAQCPFYHLEKHSAGEGGEIRQKNPANFAIFSIISGIVETTTGLAFAAGDFFLMPVSATPLLVRSDVVYLETTIPLER